MLNFKSVLEGNDGVAWILIELDCHTFTPRGLIAVASVSETEIILMGGFSGSAKSDIYLLDTKSIKE